MESFLPLQFYDFYGFIFQSLGSKKVIENPLTKPFFPLSSIWTTLVIIVFNLVLLDTQTLSNHWYSLIRFWKHYLILFFLFSILSSMCLRILTTGICYYLNITSEKYLPNLECHMSSKHCAWHILTATLKEWYLFTL